MYNDILDKHIYLFKMIMYTCDYLTPTVTRYVESISIRVVMSRQEKLLGGGHEHGHRYGTIPGWSPQLDLNCCLT